MKEPLIKQEKAIPQACMGCPTRHISDFRTLTDTELQELEQQKSLITYKVGDIVFSQGMPSEGIYCVKSGIAGLRKGDAQGNEILIRLAYPGMTLGYRAFFEGDNYSATAEVLKEATMCFIPTSFLNRILGQNVRLGREFLKHLAGDLKAAEESILQNVSLPVRTRLAHLLVSFRERFEEKSHNGEVKISLPMTRQDIAALLGTRPETIARTIHALEEDAVANFMGRTVLVPIWENLVNETEYL